MHDPLHLLLPFLAAFVFALGNVLQKRAFHEGAGVLPVFVLNNVALGLAFLPMLAMPHEPVPWGRLWQPVVAGFGFFIGSILGLIALRRGDVSLVTPLLGTKVILVAAVSALAFRVPLAGGQILAAGLTTLGVFVMGATEWRPGGRVGESTLLAVACSLGFAVCDTLIQQWAAPFGVRTFVPLLFGTLGMLSLGVAMAYGRPALRVPPPAWKWMAAAATAVVTQAMLITLAIAWWRDATGVNV
ncbi:MAG: DMT family transporter, partial [Verrucomicrobia bacterium]|nr:DMT family transporter [Verrucomicrobiota bacterium]